MSTHDVLRTVSNLLFRDKFPGQLILQVTTRCNAACPQCEMRAGSSFPRADLPKKRALQLIEAGAVKRFELLSFTGGEPFLILDDILEMASYAHTLGYRYIRTGTNAYFCMNPKDPDYQDRIRRIAVKLAASPIRNLWISLDSADPLTHEAMRRLPGVVEGIRRALPIFQGYDIYPAANLGITRNISGNYIPPGLTEEACYDSFRQGFRDFYTQVLNLGFTTVNACYPMSIPEEADGLKAAYGASSASELVNFSPIERRAIYTALYDTIPEFRNKLRIFTPRTSLLALRRGLNLIGPPPRHCRGGIDYFYVNASDGLVYPCGFRGDEGSNDFPASPEDKGCNACDWECFRDPSELTGVLRDFIRNPLRTAVNLKQDREYTQVLKEDLHYYQACGFFDGRRPPDLDALKSFKQRSSKL